MPVAVASWENSWPSPSRSRPDVCTALTEGNVHLWRARLDVADLDAADHAFLSADELVRARRFRRVQDAREFTAGRVILRRLLGAYLQADPRELCFAYGPHGKPRVVGGRDLFFSVAHSAGVALYGFCRARRIGVDLELLRDVAVMEIARQFLADDEVQELGALPVDARVQAFYRCWTRKEAYLKAKGSGLSVPLDAFAVSIARDEPRALSWSRWSPADVGRWTFVEPVVPEGFAAAVAVETIDRVGSAEREPRSELSVATL